MTMMIRIVSVVITKVIMMMMITIVMMMMMTGVHLVEGTREGGVVRGEDRGEQEEQPPEKGLVLKPFSYHLQGLSGS